MKTQKGISTIAGITIFVVVAVFAFGGVFAYEYYLQKNEQKIEADQNQNLDNNTQPVACTMEAKICPDGSSVGRSGPNCEFTECPVINQTAGLPVQSQQATEGWKTYTNDEYGFEFKHPTESEVVKNTTPIFIEYKIIDKNGFIQSLFIDSDNFPSDKRFQELLNWMPKTWISTIKTKINGYDALEMLFDNYGKIIKNIYIGKDNLTIFFQFNLDSLESVISLERLNILNSFKFVN